MDLVAFDTLTALTTLAALAAAALLACCEARAAGGPDRQTRLAIEQLKSPNTSVREEAVRRLGMLAGGRGRHLHVVPALIEALSDPDPTVGSTAAEMLRSIFRRPDMPDSRTAWEELWRQTKGRFKADQNLDPRERIRRERANLENDKGYHFMMLGQFKVAEAYFLDAVANDPGNPQYWNNLGKCFSNQGRFPDAVDRFRRALEEDPGYVPAHYNLAGAYLDITNLTGNDRTYEALGHVEVALRFGREKTDWAARWLKAKILLRMALAEVAVAREGLAAERYEIYKRASEAVARAIHIAPNVPEVRKTAALVYYGRELYFKSYKQVVRVYDLGYTMDRDFLKKLEKALRREAYEIGAEPPRMPSPKPDAKGPDERSPALLVPYRDGTL